MALWPTRVGQIVQETVSGLWQLRDGQGGTLHETVVVPTTDTLTGPTSGTTGSASTNFTITLDHPAVSTITFTPAGTVGTNTFSPTNPQITAGNSTVTFTDTAASDGTHVISVTNNGGLTDIGTVNYVTTTPATAAGIKITFGPF